MANKALTTFLNQLTDGLQQSFITIAERLAIRGRRQSKIQYGAQKP
jgi:hypothetical protein